MTENAVARARLLLELDRDAEARTLLAGLLAQDPDDVLLLCLLSQACLGADDLDGAFVAARDAVRLAPDDEWPHRLLSISLARRRRGADAVAEADTALRLAPDEWRVWINRAHVDSVTGRVSQLTVDTATRAVELAPHEAEAHAMLGAILLRLRRTKESERALREALRIDPRHYAALNNLASLDLRRHRLGRAARGFADAAALSRDDRAAAGNLHIVLAQLLRRLHWLLITAVLVVGAAATHHGSGGRLARLVCWALTMLGVALLLASGRVGSGARTRRVVGVVLGRDRLLGVWAVLLAASLVAVTVAAFTDGRSADTAASLGWLAILVGTVVTWVRGFLRRSAP